MMNPLITSPKELEALVLEYGFLPFFKNNIPGFSVEEHTPAELWFAGDREGPWEWKGPVARAGSCAYGKLFGRKAGFVSLEWYPDLVNYRRDGYDFDARYDDGLASRKDKYLYDTVARAGEVLTGELKTLCGYGGRDGKKGFDTVMTRLQMQTYLTVGDFCYKTDKNGNRYGWGVALYTTPESRFGADLVTGAYRRSPEASAKRLEEFLSARLPGATSGQISRILRG